MHCPLIYIEPWLLQSNFKQHSPQNRIVAWIWVGSHYILIYTLKYIWHIRPRFLRHAKPIREKAKAACSKTLPWLPLRPPTSKEGKQRPARQPRILGQNKRIRYKMWVYRAAQRQRQNLTAKNKLELLRFQLPPLLRVSPGGWQMGCATAHVSFPETPRPGPGRWATAPAPGSPARGRGRGFRGGAGRAGDLNLLGAEVRARADVRLRGSFLSGAVQHSGTQGGPGNGGRTGLYSQWREDSGASAPGPGGDGHAGPSAAEPRGARLAALGLWGCGLLTGKPLLYLARGPARRSGIKTPSGFQGPKSHLFVLAQAPWGPAFPKADLDVTGGRRPCYCACAVESCWAGGCWAKAAVEGPGRGVMEDVLFQVA